MQKKHKPSSNPPRLIGNVAAECFACISLHAVARRFVYVVRAYLDGGNLSRKLRKTIRPIFGNESLLRVHIDHMESRGFASWQATPISCVDPPAPGAPVLHTLSPCAGPHPARIEETGPCQGWTSTNANP